MVQKLYVVIMNIIKYSVDVKGLITMNGDE